ncbi:glycosyltransferase family 39 protein, partial [Oscillatoriales cyanobacterium LEGE 11467]
YWLMAVGYRILGVNEWAVRLPSALAAIALMGLLFYTLQKHTRIDRTSNRPNRSNPSNIDRPESSYWAPWFCAGLGAVLFALNPQSLVWGRIGVSDMLLTGCMGSALLAFFLGYASADRPDPRSNAASRRWYLAFYILSGLAVLTKGPVGIVLPAIVLGGFLLYLGQFWQVLREMQVLRGMAIFGAIVVPWYLLVWRANGAAFFDSFFGYHNFERFTRVVNQHAAPWYFYIPVVLVSFAPWSVYLPVAIARLQLHQCRHWRKQPRTEHLGLFAGFWFAGIFGFFSLASTKLPSYTLPLIPAAAILVSLQFTQDVFQPTVSGKATGLQISRWFNILFLAGVGIAFFTLPDWLGYDPAAPDLDEVLPRTGLAIVAAAIWMTAALAGELVLVFRQGRWLWSVNLVVFLTFLVFTFYPTYELLDRQRQFPLRQLAAIAAEVRQPGEELVMVDLSKTSLVFYSGGTIAFRIRPESARGYIQDSIATQPDMDTVLILGQRRKIKKIGIHPSQYRTLGKVRGYELVRASKRSIGN